MSSQSGEEDSGEARGSSDAVHQGQHGRAQAQPADCQEHTAQSE